MVNTLNDLLRIGFIEVCDDYKSDDKYRYYDGYNVIYFYTEPYYLREEKLNNYEGWQKHIPFIVTRWELLPFNVQKKLNKLYPTKFFLDEKNKQENKKMNIKEKFVLALTKEPQKSFRKAGITNGDDILTDDGSKIFLTWLLNKNAEDFKKEVVEELLKDVEGECK